MKKLILLGVAASVMLFGGEFEYGSGTFKLKGGLYGLNQEQSTDITTYTLKENHKNIFSSKWYYSYQITWYDSDDLTSTQSSLSYLSTVAPAINYKYQGLDVNIVLGRDFYKTDENQYVSAGILLGVSLPYIDTGKSSSNSDTTDTILDSMKKSKTKIMTYKIGPSINTAYKISKMFSLYLNGTYAYQTGRIKNDYADTDLHVNGSFEEFDMGVKFQPFAKDYKVGFLTLKPRLYMTLGYRYSYWKLKDVKVDITGQNLDFASSDMDMKSSVAYLGIGYSF